MLKFFERIIIKLADKKEKELVEQAAWDFYWGRNPNQVIFAENSRPDLVIGFVEGVKWYKDYINKVSKQIIEQPESPLKK